MAISNVRTDDLRDLGMALAGDMTGDTGWSDDDIDLVVDAAEELDRLRKVRAAQCKVVAVLGTIWLHFGEVRCELSVSQANELADHLQNAADISGMIPQTEDE